MIGVKWNLERLIGGLKVSDINKVEKAIISLDGGSYQKLMDAYLMKKYQFSNIYPLGVQTGTNKPTKGTPDSYVECDNGQYILIMYGSVEAASFSKLKSDILSCFDKSKLSLPVEKIAKIICAYTSTNLHIEQLEELKNLVEGVKIELIGIGTVAHDIVLKYHFLATRFLNIPIDSGQVFDIKEFINQYDASGMNAPLGVEFVSREKEIDDLKQKIMNNDLVIVSGASGIGKTRLVLEASKRLKSEQDVNIVCVKNNGQLLYNDVRETINDPGKYLLFLDDANHTMNLDSILQFCISKKADNEIDVKIVMTVRDYAKDFIKKIALNTVKFEEMVLNPLSIQDIQKILKEKFDVKNERYLRQITKIANGNIRLAIIAAISAKSNGFLAINDATDIFRNFYTPIFDENRITENETVVLCAVAIFGPVMLEPNDGMQYILTSNNISKTEYIGICYRLNSIELLDLFEKSIIRISDQSFANYILEYMLIDKKGISIKDLLLNLFPKYSSKLIYAINTVLRLFNSKITAEYIQNEINEAWAQCNKSDEKEYVKVFKSVNEEKTLLYAKRIITETKPVSYDLDIVEFPKEINNVYEKDEVVPILTQFGNSELYTEAVDLLILYFSKRPDIGKEICHGITKKMRFDIYSNEQGYNRVEYLVSQIYEKYEECKNKNFAILLICIIEKFLDYRCDGEVYDWETFKIFYLKYSEKLMEHRKKLWEYLKELREESSLQLAVDSVISNLRPQNNEEAQDIFFKDISILLQLYDDGKNIPDFSLCVIFGEIVEYVHWLERDAMELECFLCRNTEYVIYRSLVHEHVKDENWMMEEKNKKEEIENLIANYGYHEFAVLFNICKQRERIQVGNAWEMQRSIDFVFECVQCDSEKYFCAIKAYFAMNTPYPFKTNDKIARLLNLMSFNEVEALIEGVDETKQRRWRVALYEVLPKEAISIDVTKDMINFINDQLGSDDVQIPNIYALSKYKNRGIDIIEQITAFLLSVGQKKPYIVVGFFERVLDEEKVEEIIKFFENDIDKLLKLYLIAMENNNFDYNGRLLCCLVKINVAYWDKITKKWGEDFECTVGSGVFENIWLMDNYYELIDIAYKNMRNPRFGYLRYDTIINIFARSKEDKLLITEHKEFWIGDYIEKYFDDEKKMYDIFDIIATAFPEKKLKYIMKFLEKNSDLATFQKLPFFSSSRSWSDSEVPLIESEIKFLQTLLGEISGIDYLEHKLYLKEQINYKKQYKQEILKREYLQNFAYN